MKQCMINYATWVCTDHQVSLNEQGQCPYWLRAQKRWLRKKAAIEDKSLVSVGGLAEKLKCPECEKLKGALRDLLYATDKYHMARPFRRDTGLPEFFRRQKQEATYRFKCAVTQAKKLLDM